MRTPPPRAGTGLLRLCLAVAALCVTSTLGAATWGFVTEPAPRTVVEPARVELEAALLLKFSKFVRWPEGAFEDARSPLVFGVLADSEGLTTVLEQVLEGQTVKGRATQVSTIEDLRDLRGCHLLFAGPEAPSERAILEAIGGGPVLLVGARPRFAHRGGAINLYPEGDALRFEINLEAAHRAALEVSSKLLRLARLVEDSDR